MLSLLSDSAMPLALVNAMYSKRNRHEPSWNSNLYLTIFLKNVYWLLPQYNFWKVRQRSGNLNFVPNSVFSDAIAIVEICKTDLNFCWNYAISAWLVVIEYRAALRRVQSQWLIIISYSITFLWIFLSNFARFPTLFTSNWPCWCLECDGLIIFWS